MEGNPAKKDTKGEAILHIESHNIEHKKPRLWTCLFETPDSIHCVIHICPAVSPLKITIWRSTSERCKLYTYAEPLLAYDESVYQGLSVYIVAYYPTFSSMAVNIIIYRILSIYIYRFIPPCMHSCIRSSIDLSMDLLIQL